MSSTTSAHSEWVPAPERRAAYEQLYVILAAIFIAALVACNLIFQKFFIWKIDLFGSRYVFQQSVGILAYPLEYHAPKLPGRGDIDWAVFCNALKEIGYDGPVCVEVEDREFEDSLEARKESLRLSHQHLAPLLKQV